MSPEPLRVVIADDEALARKRLVQLLAQDPLVQVVGEAETGAEALALVRREKPQAVFLDIQMPPPSGLEAAREILQERSPPAVVFLTAHEEHAVEAFELRAFDYLVKPVEADRLARTLERIREATGDQQRWQRLVQEALRSALAARMDRIAVRDRETEDLEVIPVAEIDYFTARQQKTFAHVGGVDRLVTQTLTHLATVLPEDEFARTHRAYVVNFKKVVKVVPWFNGAYTLVLKDGQEVPLSRGQVASFRSKINWM